MEGKPWSVQVHDFGMSAPGPRAARNAFTKDSATARFFRLVGRHSPGRPTYSYP